jgi:hypothetical protein
LSANVGDRITLHGNTAGATPREGTITEVLGADGPPYRVRFDAGEETVVAPGPDAVITAPSVTERLERAAQRTNEAAAEAVGRARESAAEYSAKARESATEYTEKARESAQEYTEKARESAQDATGRAARKVADVAAKVAERFQK